MQLPIYNSVTMGMGWGLFLLVQTPQSAQRSHDRRVVIGARDMGWGNLSPTPFSLASIDCLHPSDKETVQKLSASIHYGVGFGMGWGGREEREIELNFIFLKPQTRVKIYVNFFNTMNFCGDEIFNVKLLPAPTSYLVRIWSFGKDSAFLIVLQIK